MSTWSVRCRDSACRHRRVTSTHPDTYKIVPRCPQCGSAKGWRIEQRAYNKRDLCRCDGPKGRNNEPFPHNTTHPECDQHPSGFYNQAKRQGAADDDIPLDRMPRREMKATDDCPF